MKRRGSARGETMAIKKTATQVSRNINYYGFTMVGIEPKMGDGMIVDGNVSVTMTVANYDATCGALISGSVRLYPTNFEPFSFDVYMHTLETEGDRSYIGFHYENYPSTPDASVRREVDVRDLTASWTEYRQYVTPSIRTPVGTYIKIPTCTFQWTNDAVFPSDAQLSWVQIRAKGAEEYVNLASVAGIGTELTARIPDDILAAEGFDWRVATLSELGNWKYSAEASCTYKVPSLSATGLYPTGTIYQGFATTFGWSLKSSEAGVYQTGATLQYREGPSGTIKSAATVTGQTSTVTVGANILPSGSLQWRVIITTNAEITVESAWQNCNNAVPPVSLTDLSPTGTIYQGFPQVFRWKFSSTLQGVSQTKAEIHYRAKGASDYQVTGNVTGDGGTVTVAANVLPKGAFEWCVMVTINTGHTSTSAWQSCNNAEPPLTLSDLYPTQKTYHGFPQIFRWALSCPVAGVYQTGAEIQYRSEGSASYKVAGRASGSANNTTVAGNVLPVGKFDWRVMVTVNTGHTATSAWQNCTNVEVAISVTGMFPDASGQAPSKVQNRFGWTFVADDEDAPGAVTQVSAVFHWRPAGQGAYKNVNVAGTAQYVDIPAGVFPAKSRIDWYVEVVANTGTKATSAVVTVSTADTLSTPVAISPAGSFLDDSVEGILFTWQHTNTTGTPQTGYELSYSRDSGASYTVMQTADGAAVSWRSEPKAFPVTTIYWRVRTKNSDGDYGNYSAPAIFAVRRNPDAPAITFFDQKPLPSIAWQSESQTGFEVEIDGKSYGMRYGSDKMWRSPDLLADGQHTIRVRIVNQYRDISDWAAVTVNVQNIPREGVRLSVAEEWAQVRASWELAEGFVTVCLLRDGVLIAVLAMQAGGYVDRTSVGSHSYVLRAFDPDGYYTDSAPATAAPRVPYAAIGPLLGDDWIALKYSPSLDRYSCNDSQQGSFVQFYGQKRPVWRPSGSQRTVHSLSYAKKRGEDLVPLLSLEGQAAIYKDYEGHLAVGVFSTVQMGCGLMRGIKAEITETQREELSYASV